MKTFNFHFEWRILVIKVIDLILRFYFIYTILKNKIVHNIKEHVMQCKFQHLYMCYKLNLILTTTNIQIYMHT